ncbi:MAG: hypothetical protein HY275_05080 [Gemmatimonadetes bacterium]|nr:hypothetical protein [Gemmatimonadota bacterium]
MAQAHVARADLARPIALRVAPDAICWFRGPVVIPSTRDEARDLIFLRRHAAALRS